MNEPTYNDHLVVPKGWLLYEVTSASRKSVKHRVDLEGGDWYRDIWERSICSCEAYDWQHHRPCRHILAVCTYIADGLATDKAKHRVLEILVKYVCDEPIKNILPIIQDVEKPRQYRLKQAA